LWLLPSDPLNQAGSASEETTSETVEDEPQDPEETVEPEDVAEPEPTAEQDEPEAFESEDPEEPEETDEPESDEPVDYEVPIGVYNASTVQGQAASVAQDLGGAGFNVPVADNWSGAVPSSTTVYFSDNEATTNAVPKHR